MVMPRIQASLKEKQLKWIDAQVKAQVYGSRSHALRCAVNLLMES